MPPSNPPPNHPPAPTKIRSLKLQFRNPNSQPPSPAATPPPPPQQQYYHQPVASSSTARPPKDKTAPATVKKKKTAKKLSTTPKVSPAPTLLTAGTSSRPQVHQIVRKPPAQVFAAEPTAGFDDDGNSTLSELSSADDDDDRHSGGGGGEAPADGRPAAAADEDDMEDEPRWDEEFNGAWERRRGSFPSEDDRNRSGGDGDDSSSAFDEDMYDSDGADVSASEHSDGVRVLSFDSTGARVLLGPGGLDDGGAWSEDSSEADDEEEELWFEDYEQFGTIDMDVDGEDSPGALAAAAAAAGPSASMESLDDLQQQQHQQSQSSQQQLPGSTLPSAEVSAQPSPTEHELDQQAFQALDFLDDGQHAADYEDFQPHDALHMLEDMDGQLIFSALADALGNLGANDKGANIFEWATESEGDSDGSKDAARMDDLWDDSTDDDHYFGDEEGDTTDSLPEDEVDEAIKRSLLEEEGAEPSAPVMSASLVRQIANGSDTRSTPSLVSPALSSAKPAPLPSSAAPSPMDIVDPSPPPIPLPTPAANGGSTSRSPSVVSEAATVSSAGHPSRPRPPASDQGSLKKAPSLSKPAMGCFIPAPTPVSFKSVIIDGAEDRNGAAPPPTPFARRKAAEKAGARSRGQSLSLKTGSTGRKRDRQKKVKYPFVPKTKRTRYGSLTPSHMSPRPPLREDTPSSPDVQPVSLEDVLDTSLFHHGVPSSTSDPSLHATSASATDRERFLADHSVRNLRRWDRVSIGTFRGRLGGGGVGGAPSSRNAFAPQSARPTLAHPGSAGGGRPASQGYDHSPSKGSIFRSEQDVEAARSGGGERTLVMSPVILPAGEASAPVKGKERELEGFVL